MGKIKKDKMEKKNAAQENEVRKKTGEGRMECEKAIVEADKKLEEESGIKRNRGLKSVRC